MLIEAGRELDALVAEKVLGCTVVHDGLPACGCPHFIHGQEVSDELKFYSSRIECAMEIVERMRQDGFSFKAWQSNLDQADYAVVSFVCGNGPCKKHGTDFHNHHGAYDVDAETLQLAICRAALITLKVVAPTEVEEQG